MTRARARGNSSPSWNEIKAELEVAMPAGASQTLRGLFNGDKRRAPHVWPASELPVKLHPSRDDKLVVDWKAWDEQGGLAATQARGTADEAVADLREASG